MVVCEKREEVEDKNQKLVMGGEDISKVLSATYVGMSLSRKGINDEINVKRGSKAAVKARHIVAAIKLNIN